MHLLSATIRNYRIHRELTVEFDRGRTLIGGPNETGKSTFIEAIHRALFLRSRVGGEIQQGMQSNLPGAQGHPEVEVTFHAGGYDYHLSKRFSGGPTGTTKLTQDGGQTWNGDEAEARLASLLAVDAPVGGRGAENRLAQQWAHLWVWQGKSGEDPCLHAGGEHATLLRRLQESGGGAAMQSECDSRVAAYFSDAVGNFYTDSGRVKKGSDRERVESAVQEAEEKHRLAEERVRRLQQAVMDFETSAAIIEQTKEDLKGLEKQRSEVAARRASVEKLTSQEKSQQTEVRNATEKFDALRKVQKQIEGLQEKAKASKESLAPRQKEVGNAETNLAETRERFETTERAYSAASNQARSVRLRRDLAQATVQLFEKKAVVEQLEAKAAQIRERQERLAALRRDLAKIPEIDARRLKKIQSIEKEATQSEAALEAMAAGIEVVATDHPVRVGEKELSAGESELVTETMDIAVGDSLRLRIRPGGGDRLAEAREAVAKARVNLQASLDQLGLNTVIAAVNALAQRNEFQGRIDQEEAILQEMDAAQVPDLLTKAQEEEATAQADVDRRLEQVTDAVPAADLAAAKETLMSEQEAVRAAESAEVECKTERDAAQKKMKVADERLAQLRQSIEKETRSLEGFQAQLRLLLENSGDDESREQALVEALSARKAAEEELEKTRRALANLQPELLEADHKRLQRAWEEAHRQQDEAKTKQTEAKVELRSDGSDDPEGDLALAKARLESARRHHEGVKRKAEAIRLVNALFTQEQQALADQFTRPLVEKVSGYLQCLYGPDARAGLTLGDSVFTGMQLVRSGNGAGAVPFESLSGGAREQVAAAVRLAMAEVLAADHGGCLPVVFDDAFAYSDPDRVKTLQRMLDLAASRGLQVIVLTCNPSDYAGLGARQVTLAAPTHTVGPFAAPPPTESGADNSTDLSIEPEPDTRHQTPDAPPSPTPAASEEQRKQFLSRSPTS